MKSNLKILPIQTDIIWEEIESNLKIYDSILDKVTSVDLIIFPEMFTTGFTNNTRLSEKMDGMTVRWMKEWANKINAHLCGSIIIEEDSKFYNRFILVDPSGTVYHYDKRHLFGFAGESEKFTMGQERIIWNINGWRICPLICYDLRFPVWSRNTKNYDVLIYIASWPDTRIEVWRTLLRARAIENLSYVVGVNRIGKDGAGLSYSGFTSLISPVGETLYEVSQSEMVKELELDSYGLATTRYKFPFLSDGDRFEIL